MNSAGGGNVPTDAGRYEYAPVWPEIIRPMSGSTCGNTRGRARSRLGFAARRTRESPGARRPQHPRHLRARHLRALDVADAERDRRRVGAAVARRQPHRVAADEHDALRPDSPA